MKSAYLTNGAINGPKTKANKNKEIADLAEMAIVKKFDTVHMRWLVKKIVRPMISRLFSQNPGFDENVKKADSFYSFTGKFFNICERVHKIEKNQGGKQANVGCRVLVDRAGRRFGSLLP